MIISKIEIIPYKIKLKNSFLNSKREYFFKEGFIVELVADGIIGYGEVVFLEGFSNYSKQEVNWKVEELKSLLINDSHYTKNDLFDLFKVFKVDVKTDLISPTIGRSTFTFLFIDDGSISI